MKSHDDTKSNRDGGMAGDSSSYPSARGEVNHRCRKKDPPEVVFQRRNAGQSQIIIFPAERYQNSTQPIITDRVTRQPTQELRSLTLLKTQKDQSANQLLPFFLQNTNDKNLLLREPNFLDQNT